MSSPRKKAKKAGKSGTTGRRMARTVLTKERRQRIVEGIEKGFTRSLAARYAGISESTLYKWLADGRERKTPAATELAEAVTRAELASIAKHVGNIENAGSGDWRASAWLLERRHRDEFGKTVVEQRHTNADGTGPVEVGGRVSVALDPSALAVLSAEQLRALAYPDCDTDTDIAGDSPAGEGA